MFADEGLRAVARWLAEFAAEREGDSVMKRDLCAELDLPRETIIAWQPRQPADYPRGWLRRARLAMEAYRATNGRWPGRVVFTLDETGERIEQCEGEAE